MTIGSPLLEGTGVGTGFENAVSIVAVGELVIEEAEEVLSAVDSAELAEVEASAMELSAEGVAGMMNRR